MDWLFDSVLGGGFFTENEGAIFPHLAVSTIASVNPSIGDREITVADPAEFPNPLQGHILRLVLDLGGPKEEIVHYSKKTGSVLTLTSALAEDHDVGTSVGRFNRALKMDTRGALYRLTDTTNSPLGAIADGAVEAVVSIPAASQDKEMLALLGRATDGVSFYAATFESLSGTGKLTVRLYRWQGGSFNLLRTDVTTVDFTPDTLYAVRLDVIGTQLSAYFREQGDTAATGSITTVVAASIIEGETFVLFDGVTRAEFAFDKGTYGGALPTINISAAITADDVRDAVISDVTGVNITPTDGGAGTVTLTNNVKGVKGNNTGVQVDTVADATFAITDMAGGLDFDGAWVSGDVVSTESDTQLASGSFGVGHSPQLAGITGDVFLDVLKIDNLQIP